jgi:hypothetical protein
MNSQGSITTRPVGSHSLWHLRAWSDYISRIVHPAPKVPARMTRRQELLAAQERRRKEQHAHVLELLREVKDKHQQPGPGLKA